MSRSRSLPSMPYLAGDRSRHHAWARTSVTATLLIVAGALSSTIVAATASASVASDHALASRINMHRTDLPAGAEWTSSPSTPNPPGWVATSHKVIACIQHVAGQALVVSPDPFGLGTAPSGDVTADVTSPTFFVKGPSQLPSADSEVVMTATAVQATADFRAVDRSSALPCLKAAFQAIAVAEQVPAGTKLTLKLLTPPPMGRRDCEAACASRSPAPPSATSSTKPSSTPSAGPSWRSASPPPASHSPPVGHSRSAKASSLGPRPSSAPEDATRAAAAKTPDRSSDRQLIRRG